MNRKRKAVIENNEISEVRTYSLGGIEQKVLIEGKTGSLPIVVSLHGGPGFPLPFCVGGRGLFPEFTDKCILVSWDQYGCGINRAVISDDFTVRHFVEMTKDLILHIKEDFRENRIYLFGASWGSILSALTAYEIPEMIDGVITYGQVLRKLMRSDDVTAAIMSSDAPDKRKKEIKQILPKDKLTQKETIKITKFIRKYTEGYRSKSEPKMALGSIVRGVITSPDYRIKDVLAILFTGYTNNNSLLAELAELDLSDTLEGITIPYHIIQGSADIVTSTKGIAEFVGRSTDGYLRLEVVKDASHIPGKNGMDAVLRAFGRLKDTTGEEKTNGRADK